MKNLHDLVYLASIFPYFRYLAVPALKKLWILFVFPLAVVCFMVFVKGRITHTARFAISAMNPIGTIKYHLSNSADAIADAILPAETDKENSTNPFENFVTATPQPTPGTDVTYDSDYPIVAMTYAPVLNDVTYRRQNC